MRLNLGCGHDRRAGWTNVDHPKSPVTKDMAWDFDNDPSFLPDDSVEHSEGSHVLEHLRNPLFFMEELWKITKPEGTALFRLPYGSSDNAWEDPTHVRPYFLNSFGYFSQPYYWRASYSYGGDWQPKFIKLHMDDHFEPMEDRQLLMLVNHQRNVVREMEVVLEAVKPRRLPHRELQEAARVQFVFNTK